jgi:hypothetical protein
MEYWGPIDRARYKAGLARQEEDKRIDSLRERRRIMKCTHDENEMKLRREDEIPPKKSFKKRLRECLCWPCQ